MRVVGGEPRGRRQDAGDSGAGCGDGDLSDVRLDHRELIRRLVEAGVLTGTTKKVRGQVRQSNSILQVLDNVCQRLHTTRDDEAARTR